MLIITVSYSRLNITQTFSDWFRILEFNGFLDLIFILKSLAGARAF